MLKRIQEDKAIRLTLGLTTGTLIGAYLFLGKADVGGSSVFNQLASQPATAQQPPTPQQPPNPQVFRTENVWQQVYERLPDLPREDQYVSKETGKVNPNSTLVNRLIRYHVYVKSRPPNYRFDWKLTMADYLGANEYLVESAYPGSTALQQNPMEGDRAVIQKLTRRQREALIDALVSVFSIGNSATPAPEPSASPPPSPPSNPTTTLSTPPNSGATPSLPKPGDAQLLLPK